MNKLRQLQINPFWGGFIASFAVFAGALVSLYADEIKNSFPIYFSLNPHNYGVFSFATFGFWFSFFLFVILTAFRQYSIDADLNAQRDSLINTLQSLPPHDFSLKFRDLYNRNETNLKKIKVLVESVKSNEAEAIAADDIASIEESIRVLLDAYINLAKIWDNPESVMDESIIYRANIMAYYSINEIPTKVEGDILTFNNFFVDKNIASIKASLDGILVLVDNKLTTTTETPDPTSDNQVKPLVLPVTIMKTEGKRFQNIPGAPRAIVDGKAQWLSDTSEIITICRNEDHFDKEILEKIDKYYRTDTKGKSIISIPLFFGEEQAASIGVINIYRNKKLILRNEVRAEEFCAFLEPFNSILCNELYYYAEACKLFDN